MSEKLAQVESLELWPGENPCHGCCNSVDVEKYCHRCIYGPCYRDHPLIQYAMWGSFWKNNRELLRNCIVCGSYGTVRHTWSFSYPFLGSFGVPMQRTAVRIAFYCWECSDDLLELGVLVCPHDGSAAVQLG